MTHVEQRRKGAPCARTDPEVEAGGEVAQYGGLDAERDVGPPTDPVRAATEVEERRQRAMSVSPGASMYPRPRPGNLREIAERIEDATGLRVQILGGKLVMSPTPRGKHAGVVKQVRRQLEAVALPDGLDVYEVSSIALPEDPDDYATPDLIVLPVEWEEDDDWLADAADAALAVEVISQSEKSRDIRDKADWYAVVRVPVLFVIDPRKGTWALHTDPDNGAYRDVLPGKFGESVLLPEPFGVEIVTDGFPVYGEAPRAAPRSGG
ncbi:Uma2 family endonuclease [Streptomyces sp. NBC_00459]|uniref:Uma2 family endonuclease n=1 Tax=Streptomyces sp. NBC_00459 TaxID=2975749 RepID=UPI002E19C150